MRNTETIMLVIIAGVLFMALWIFAVIYTGKTDTRKMYIYKVYHYGHRVGTKCMPEGLSGIEGDFYGGAEKVYYQQTNTLCGGSIQAEKKHHKTL